MPAETLALGNGPWMHLRKNPSRSYYPRTADPLSSTRDCNVCEFGSGVTPQLIQAARHGDKVLSSLVSIEVCNPGPK